ncbi:MAG: hypothetical protein QN155_05995 [Armatimonadota bacterium]|nr:hypothetical protein [Armatimonadota bacterium]MDR7403061.1 hypothetical protein [Armatimonadota bacterium]
MDVRHVLSRREFLRWSAAAGVALSWQGAGTLLRAAAAPTVRRHVADVLRFSLRPRGWRGQFGSVTFRIHPVFVGGRRAYHIRTDASDAAFARTVGLVHAPKLAKAIDAGAVADYYVFTNPASGQLPVVSTVPGQEDYTPAFRLHRVTFTRSPRVLTSAAQVRDAEADGRLRVQVTDVVVNYPVVKWPDGEMPHDTIREAYLGQGQLLKPVDVDRREVTFKLQQCFPGEWYIVTDTSAAPMAPMMRVPASPRTARLTAAGATARILVFGNGIKGPGPMGFQPSVVDSLPGNPVWSPFWDHFTFTWADGRTPVVVRDQKQLLERERAGDLRRWPGTPDTGGELFVVNCPIPITAPLLWRPPA